MKQEIEIVQVPALSDNYIHVIFYNDSAVVVDPAAARPVMAAVTARRCTVRGVLVTHHHY
ncbi:MAG: hydroxyacylglutathione hydrolase, partial [Chitinivibrionales bacterium]|nr:hydroxyacylglutathione hydrolase [Chitinivibrionales bacterium]